MALEVYWGSGSGPSWRVLLALAAKGVPFESKLLSFSKRENRTPEFPGGSFWKAKTAWMRRFAT